MEKSNILNQFNEMTSEYYHYDYDFLEKSELKDCINNATVLKALISYNTYGSVSNSFEGEKCEVLLCKTNDGKNFIRVNWHVTSSESNGRPESRVNEWCYLLSDTVDLASLNETNWKDYLKSRMILITWKNYCGVCD